MKANKKALDKIDSTIKRYKLFDSSEPLLIAVSGGKDSLFCYLHLKTLGYNLIPIVVDIGLDKKWTKIVVNTTRKIINETPNIVSLKNSNLKKDKNSIVENIFRLKTVLQDNDNNIVPCTLCYNIKISLIESVLEKYNSNKVIFGHHAYDAISSLIKLGIMIYDNQTYDFYDSNRFKKIVNDLHLECTGSCENRKIFNSIKMMVEQGDLVTDEAPRSVIPHKKNDFEIVRPLFDVYEIDIENFWNEGLKIFPDAECGRSEKKGLTPREIVTKNLLVKLNNKRGLEIIKQFHELCQIIINESGELIPNSKMIKHIFFKSGYKKRINNEIKI